MNTKGLARMYDTLGMWERLPLRLAAQARGDETEAHRLLGPVRAMYLREPMWTELALRVMALIYLTEQLDAAAGFLFARWMAGGEEADDWAFTAAAYAYFFTANAAAWRRFCADLGVDPEALARSNTRGGMLSLCEPYLPGEAPSAEQMRQMMSGRTDAELVTADCLYDSWRSLLDSLGGPQAPRAEGHP